MAGSHADVVQTFGLTRRFGDFTAVEDVSLTIGAGEIFGLIGPNGAGKTTLIKMLTTMLPPTSGSALVAGFDIAGQPNAAMFASRMNFSLGLTSLKAADGGGDIVPVPPHILVMRMRGPVRGDIRGFGAMRVDHALNRAHQGPFRKLRPVSADLLRLDHDEISVAVRGTASPLPNPLRKPIPPSDGRTNVC
jgi:energy-coupling factor transporter ATP-binding protein EcfA2